MSCGGVLSRIACVPKRNSILKEESKVRFKGQPWAHTHGTAKSTITNDSNILINVRLDNPTLYCIYKNGVADYIF